jgi:Undecaprenyl-phosphate glucose phosphotransferase
MVYPRGCEGMSDSSGLGGVKSLSSRHFSGTWVAPSSDPTQRLSVFVSKLLAAEFLAIAASAYVATVAYHFAIWNQGPSVERYIGASLGLATLILVVSLALQHYAEIQIQPRHKFLWSGIGAVLLAFSLFVSIVFLLKIGADYSRGTFLFQFIGVTAAVLTARAIGFSKLHAAISGGHVKARRVALIGDSRHVQQFATRLRSGGVQTVWSFDYPGHKHRSPLQGARIGAAANEEVDDVIAKCRELRLDNVFLIVKHKDLPTVSALTKSLSVMPVGVHVILMDWLDLLATPRIVEFGNVTTIQVAYPPLSPLDCALKRAFDVTLAAVGLLILSPLLAIVSIAIKIDSPGPVLFRQTRHGYNNEGIQVFKFRTMRVMEPGHAFVQAVKNDPRVTNIGRILRRTSLDELPQLFNVLRGDMSIVGPRPHATSHNKMFEALIPPLSRRHKVKPGITGWAQVNGSRGETDTLEKMQRRVELDLYYIDNWSLLLDCKIVLLTVLSRKAHMNAC